MANAPPGPQDRSALSAACCLGLAETLLEERKLPEAELQFRKALAAQHKVGVKGVNCVNGVGGVRNRAAVPQGAGG